MEKKENMVKDDLKGIGATVRMPVRVRELARKNIDALSGYFSSYSGNLLELIPDTILDTRITENNRDDLAREIDKLRFEKEGLPAEPYEKQEDRDREIQFLKIMAVAI